MSLWRAFWLQYSCVVGQAFDDLGEDVGGNIWV